MSNTMDKRLLLTSETFIKQKDYWENKLTGDINRVLFSSGTGNGADAGKQREQVPISFSPGICSRLLDLSRRSDLTIYIVLLAALKTLLYRYSGGETTASVSPVYEPNVTEQTLNDFVVIVDHIDGANTFKELLLQVSQSVREAYDNQDYPFPELNGSLLQYSDIVCLSGNIHDPGRVESLTDAVVFSFERNDTLMGGTVTFDPGIYEAYYIKQLSRHFITTLDVSLANINTPLSGIFFLSEEEKKQLLYDFNDTGTAYPADRTIHELFEKQADETPDKTAVICLAGGDGNRIIQSVTYRELNEKADGLANILREKGVTHDSIVAIMVEPSVPMVFGILGILKAGGAYLPIGLDYPEERKRYILADSGAKVLLTDLPEGHHLFNLFNCQLSIVNFQLLMRAPEAPLHHSSFIETPNHFGGLAYVIYTSGSTGSPRGVLVEHKSVMRLVKNNEFMEFNSEDRLLRTGALEFDASTFEIWGSLLNGLTLYSAFREDIIIPGRLKEIIRLYRIDTMWLTAPLFNRLCSEDVEVFDGLKNLIVGGDVLSPSHINRVRRRFSSLNIINGYGPTENTTFSTTFPIRRYYEKSIPIGKPISNSTAYILGKSDELLPIGAAGELVAGGDGVARGYLNNPELTKQKFLRGPGAVFSKRAPGRRRQNLFYRTGDLARRLPCGNIEFLGRLDNQLKIRGFRIEAGEIEHCLLKHDSVAEALVVCRENSGEKYLCAYIVGTGGIVDFTLLREHLNGSLPDFMIPAHFVAVDAFPLNRNGKVDIRALPEPASGTCFDDFAAPRTEIEKTLTAIWAEVLDIPEESIGIDANFFELGGHSLKIGILATRIHKTFNVKIELADVFMIQTIRELAEYIEGAETDLYTAIEPAPKKEFYALSSAQKRLYAVQHVEKENISYNVSLKVTVEGELDKKRLEEAFHKLIQRHEGFRTSIEIIDAEPVQRIHDHAPFNIEYYDNIDSPRRGIHHFIRPFDLSRAPLLRTGLIKMEQGKHLLMVDMHHIISDGISLAILVEEFMAFYGGEELPPLRIQYKDVSEWRNNGARSGKEIEKQETYWLTQFQEEIPGLRLPTDFPRPARFNFEGDHIRFEVGKEELEMLRNLALEEDTTLYTVTLAVFYVLLAKLSGREDIVVGTVVNGRGHADLENVVGMLLNTLALRNYPGAEKTFKEFLKEVKERTLDAFENQDYPFEELVRKRNAMFDVAFGFENDMETLDMEMAGLKIKPYDYKSPISKFDMTFIGEEVAGKLFFLVEYSTQLFKKKTIENFWNYYMEIAACAVKNKNFQLKDINISHDLLTPKADMPDIQLRF